MIQETRVDETTQTDVRRMPGPAAGGYAPTPTPILRLSWGALIAGAVVALATQAILAVLGLAIGLSLAPVGAEGFAIGAGIWWLLISLIALFAGGYVAGRFSYIRHPFHSSMHGVMTWCFVTALSIFFIGWMGGVVASGPMSAVVDDLVAQQETATTAPAQPTPGVGTEIDPAATATGAAWWTFFALLLGVAAAGFGGYLAAPQNLRETIGMRGTMRGATESESTV